MTPSTTEPRGRNGARLSPITMPGHNLGKPAPNKGMKLPTETYTWAEVSALMAACSTRGSCGLRDCALIATQFRTGARINELLSATPADLDLPGLDLFIRFPKRDKRGVAHPRHVPLDARTAAVIERWMVRRAQLGIGRSSPIFCVVDKRTRGQKVHASVWRERLKVLAGKAGIEKRVHPHGFRKTCAIDLHVHEGAPLRVVQDWLGHQDLATTALYLRGPAASAAAAQFARGRRWPDEAPAAPDLAGIFAAALQASPALAVAMAEALAPHAVPGGASGPPA